MRFPKLWVVSVELELLPKVVNTDLLPKPKFPLDVLVPVVVEKRKESFDEPNILLLLLLEPNAVPNGVVFVVAVVVSKAFVTPAGVLPNILPALVFAGLLKIEVDPNVAACPNIGVVEVEGVKKLLGLELTAVKFVEDEPNTLVDVFLGVENSDPVDVTPNKLPEVPVILAVPPKILLFVEVWNTDACGFVVEVVFTPNIAGCVDAFDGKVESCVELSAVAALNVDMVVVAVILFVAKTVDVVVVVDVAILLMPNTGTDMPKSGVDVVIGLVLKSELLVVVVKAVSELSNKEVAKKKKLMCAKGSRKMEINLKKKYFKYIVLEYR
ncbi:hypothetical protein QE152_g34954 [Popillia japonica]|uniref:Uncharacterized protein n=1 Tax=Popillia japonica TaxID=7064 RepID=A0AAW1ISL1_POPJA